ncbi:AEC family transporter [Salipiger bermudensis]|uniref:AEC family transporter n=1 Tax=Salipiger bermudensis TaxID=344736 RepID=UPI001C9956CD|nr:AEC family transporter [Salipiger bermudensis]MBY6005914.1 AEC family transporter [Salipiger bermudensis]
MLAPLLTLLPIYLLILLGFGVIKARLVSPEALPQLSRFMLIVCVPVLIFSAVANAGDLTAFNWGFILVYTAASLVTLTLTREILRRAFGQGPGQSWVVALSSTTPNSVFLGYPITMIVFPEVADRLFAWVIVVENMLVIPLALTLGDVLSRDYALPPTQAIRHTAKTTLQNPTVMGLLAGLAFGATGLALAAPLEKTRMMIVAAAPLVSLFLVGGNVAQSKLHEVDAPVFLLAGMKLLLHPALVFAALSLLPGLTREELLGATLFASMPMFSLSVIFAAKYRAEKLASSALVLATLLGAVTVGLFVVLVSA